MKKTRKKTSAKRLLLLLALILALLSLVGGALASRQEANGDVVALSILYKLDPRLSGGVHMGERWVSPRLYDIVSGDHTYTIEVMVEAVDSNGARTVVDADWSSSDTDVATVTPRKGDGVAIHVRGQGAARLEVSAGGLYQVIYLNAAYQTAQCANLRVKVSQKEEPTLRAGTCTVMLPIVINH